METLDMSGDPAAGVDSFRAHGTSAATSASVGTLFGRLVAHGVAGTPADSSLNRATVTVMAVVRTPTTSRRSLAVADGTRAAWVRTALSMVGFGLAILGESRHVVVILGAS